MPVPFVSVVIVNYNGKHFLPACLDGLRAQTYPADSFEVIVSDNGSTDGSLELIRDQYLWVRVLENGRNLGFAGGNNIAFKAGRGEYLALLNNDTAPLPDWLEKLVQAAEANPRAGMVNGHSRLFYDQLEVCLESDILVPGENDPRRLGVMLSNVNSGLERGVVQYLQGFYGWEEFGGTRFRWTDGGAALGIPVPPGDDGWVLRFTLSAPHAAGRGIHARLKLGGAVLAEWDVDAASSKLCEVNLPATARSQAVPLVQNAGSTVNRDGYGQDRGTYAQNNELFFEVDRSQYASEPIFAACGANLLIRRSLIDEIGAFDERFFMYYEDTDLSWRARLSGWDIIYASDAVIRHIHCGSSKEWSPSFLFHTSRNRLAMLMKNGSFRQVARNWGRYYLAAVKHTLGLAKAFIRRDAGRRAIWNNLKIQYKSCLSLLVWLPRLLWDRTGILGKRRTSAEEIDRWLTT